MVVLNKSDLCVDPLSECEAVRCRLPIIDVVAVSAIADTGLDALARLPCVRHRRSRCCSSGVGKSTLVNRLLGAESGASAISEVDGKGGTRPRRDSWNCGWRTPPGARRDAGAWRGGDESRLACSTTSPRWRRAVVSVTVANLAAPFTTQSRPTARPQSAQGHFKRRNREAALEETKKHDKAAVAEHKRR